MMLLPARYSDPEGFTLVEFMVAVLIMMAGLLALLQSVNIAIATNGSNKKRADAIIMADQAMALERGLPFSALTSNSGNIKHTKKSYAGLGFVNYSVTDLSTKNGAAAKTLQVIVSWRENKIRKAHSLTTVITNPN